MTSKHKINFRIYYEDTDAAGIVYYANYLKFAERARTEWLRELGVNQSQLMGEQGIGFVARHCESDFIAPAKLDDLIEIETSLHEIGKARMKMEQIIRKDQIILVKLLVIIACINQQGKPVRLPKIYADS